MLKNILKKIISFLPCTYDSDLDWVRSREGYCYRIVPQEIISEILELISNLYNEVDRLKEEYKDYDTLEIEGSNTKEILKDINCIVIITKVLEKEVSNGLIESFNVNHPIYPDWVYHSTSNEKLFQIMKLLEEYHKNKIPMSSIKP